MFNSNRDEDKTETKVQGEMEKRLDRSPPIGRHRHG